MADAFQRDAFQINAFQMESADIGGVVTSTNTIQLPVDCVLAGQQWDVRSGRVAGRFMKHTFGE